MRHAQLTPSLRDETRYVRPARSIGALGPKVSGTAGGDFVRVLSNDPFTFYSSPLQDVI